MEMALYRLLKITSQMRTEDQKDSLILNEAEKLYIFYSDW